MKGCDIALYMYIQNGTEPSMQSDYPKLGFIQTVCGSILFILYLVFGVIIGYLYYIAVVVSVLLFMLGYLLFYDRKIIRHPLIKYMPLFKQHAIVLLNVFMCVINSVFNFIAGETAGCIVYHIPYIFALLPAVIALFIIVAERFNSQSCI